MLLQCVKENSKYMKLNFKINSHIYLFTTDHKDKLFKKSIFDMSMLSLNT